MSESLLTSEQIATIVKTHINDYGQLCDSDDFEIFAKNISNLVTSKVQERIENLNAALVQIASHVGACCGGVDVLSKTGNYSDTAESIIKRIDENRTRIDGGIRVHAWNFDNIAIWANTNKKGFENATLILDEDVKL